MHAGSVVDLVSLLQIHAILPSWQVLHAPTCTSGTPLSANALLKVIILIEKTLESAAGKANVFSILYSGITLDNVPCACATLIVV